MKSFRILAVILGLVTMLVPRALYAQYNVEDPTQCSVKSSLASGSEPTKALDVKAGETFTLESLGGRAPYSWSAPSGCTPRTGNGQEFSGSCTTSGEHLVKVHGGDNRDDECRVSVNQPPNPDQNHFYIPWWAWGVIGFVILAIILSLLIPRLGERNRTRAERERVLEEQNRDTAERRRQTQQTEEELTAGPGVTIGDDGKYHVRSPYPTNVNLEFRRPPAINIVVEADSPHVSLRHGRNNNSEREPSPQTQQQPAESAAHDARAEHSADDPSPEPAATEPQAPAPSHDGSNAPSEPTDTSH